MHDFAKFAGSIAVATVIAVVYLSRRIRRARHELGGEIEAALVVALSTASPPTPGHLHVVEDKTVDERPEAS